MCKCKWIYINKHIRSRGGTVLVHCVKHLCTNHMRFLVLYVMLCDLPPFPSQSMLLPPSLLPSLPFFSSFSFLPFRHLLAEMRSENHGCFLFLWDAKYPNILKCLQLGRICLVCYWKTSGHSLWVQFWNRSRKQTKCPRGKKHVVPSVQMPFSQVVKDTHGKAPDCAMKKRLRTLADKKCWCADWGLKVWRGGGNYGSYSSRGNMGPV